MDTPLWSVGVWGTQTFSCLSVSLSLLKPTQYSMFCDVGKRVLNSGTFHSEASLALTLSYPLLCPQVHVHPTY